MNIPICDPTTPKYLRYEFAKHLSVKDALHLCETNKTCKELCKDDYFWKLLFSSYPLVRDTKPETFQWLQWYKYLKENKVFDMDINQILLFGANYNILPLIEYAVKHGADPTLAITIAAANGNLEIVNYLVKHGANVHVKSDIPFVSAAKYGHLNVIKYLVQNGINIDTYGKYALYYAAKRGYTRIVNYLLENGNFPIFIDIALIIATTHAHLKTIKSLVNYGANINVQFGLPIRIAASNGYLAIVKYFVEHGANIYVNNNSPLRKAAYNGYLNVVKYLVEHHADIHAKNDQALYNAIENNNYKIVKYLLEHGANIHTNKVLKLLEKKGYSDILNYLNYINHL